MSKQPQVSFVVATHNRRDVAVETITRLQRCGLHRSAFEIIVVDNASDDGTPDAVADMIDVLVRLDHNAGSCAKSCGVERATARYIVFLDDDSFPRPGSVAQMIEHFEADARLGAAGFVIHLQDGKLEGSALPDVFVGCGVGFRAEALRAAGGLDSSFFMQAEEYDLAFRMTSAGWRVKMFDDLHVDHLKTPVARQTERTTYHDIRNNLRVAARYLPRNAYAVYRADWLQRYRWLAEMSGHDQAFRRGARKGRRLAFLERWTHRKHRLTPAAFEHFFGWHEVAKRMCELHATGVRRIILADLGKNVFAYLRGARKANVDVLAIVDDGFCAPGRSYRGVPIVPLDEASGMNTQATVVANCSAVHGSVTYHRLLERDQRPVYHWFQSRPTVNDPEMNSATIRYQTDDIGAGRVMAMRA